MLYPSIFSENLFDDLMDFSFPTFRDFNFDDVDRKLYGKHAARLMKTDVHEHDDLYEIDIDLPGFKKDQIQLTLEKGYLTVTAAKKVEKDEGEKGKTLRKERYDGTLQRSFYVGDTLTEKDITAKLEHGVLSLSIPKKAEEKLPEKKLIAIEG